MREELPLVSYERDMNHNYMVLGKHDFFGTADDNSRNYRVRMLLENKIQGLLPITHRQANGESKYYYEINSLQPLNRIMEKSALKYQELRALFLGCIKVFDRLEEYLLNGAQIIMKSDFIYVNVENMEPYFVCYPEYTGDVRAAFAAFVDELLTHIDHTDEQAVMLGYQVYRYTRNENYVLSEIRKFMECSVCSAEDILEKSRDEEKPQDFYSVPEDDVMYDDEDDLEDMHGRSGSKRELIGGIFCMSAALCAGAVIFCAKTLKIFKLSGEHELYLYGAAAMALAASVLFFACYIKAVRLNAKIEGLNEEETDKVYEELIRRDIVNDLTNKAAACNDNDRERVYVPASNETVCLGGGGIEERILRGKINGNEVNVPLNRLPLTVGKLGSVSDFIINDNAVSKMHARFEEHAGKVCVCDLNSTNGTVRNGETIAINTPVPLEPGDTLRFGRSCFTYC